jgi:hypothetical protein
MNFCDMVYIESLKKQYIALELLQQNLAPTKRFWSGVMFIVNNHINLTMRTIGWLLGLEMSEK